MEKRLKLQLLEMYSEYNLNLVLTIFEMNPYDIFILQDENGELITISSVGEADRKNCVSQYLGCMAEKRGIDRCVQKLINAYEYGISSEVEAEDFKKSI